MSKGTRPAADAAAPAAAEATPPHESAHDHVRGSALYTDDQVPMRGMVHLWPVVAPHAHARIVRLDASPAHELPGVLRVLAHEDVPGINDCGPVVHDEELLPTDTVHHWGQAVAWVVGESEEAARLGAAAVIAEYEPLEPIRTIGEAIAAGSFHGVPQRMQRGDVEAELAAAPHVVEGEVEVGAQDHFYLETQAAWAARDPDGTIRVTSSTQHPSETQAVIARVLGIPRNLVTVTCLRMGGGFGGKESQAAPYAALAALAAHLVGRPARIRLPRQLDMTLTGKRHPFLGRYRAGFDDDGSLLALDMELFSDAGWTFDLSAAVMQRAMFHADNSYRSRAMRVVGQVCKTHKTSNTAFRGFGGPQGMLVVEDALDRIARERGLPPHVVRQRNLYREGDVTHYGQVVQESRLDLVWDGVSADAHLEPRLAEVARANRADPHRKRGIAITPVKFGISFTATVLNQAGALVLVYTDGSIQLNHGGTEMGQGLHTKMIAVASRTLGVAPRRIRSMPTATDKVPNTSATAASSGSDLNGAAVRQACLTLQSRLAGVAATMLGLIAPEALHFERDEIWSLPEPGRRLGFDEVVAEAYRRQVQLSATGFYRTPNIHFDADAGTGRPFHYFAYGAAVSEVEVDGFTGQWALRRVDIVHDVGETLHEGVDRGQIEGGFVQGMGWLTMEEFVWDDAVRPRTTEPSTYKIPTVTEVPEAFRVRLLERVPQEDVVFGSKAVGEPPFMLALSVREALRAAVAAFGDEPTQVPLAAPATPEAILTAIEHVARDRPTAAHPDAIPAD